MKRHASILAPFFPLAILIVAAAGGCATGGRLSITPSESSDGPLAVIDAHLHTRFTGKEERTSKIPQTQARFLAELRENNVVGGVAHTGSDGGGYEDLKVFGVMHCGGVDAKVDVKRLEDGLQSGKYGCIKVYLGYVHQFAYDKGYEPVYRLAKKYDVPVVFHTGDTYSDKAKLKYADPLTIDEVATDHRDVTFVIAHLGNPWIESGAEVAYKNPNVYLDGSALMIGDLSRLSEEDLQEYVIKPLSWVFRFMEDPTKLMFGTDWPLTPIKGYLDAFKRAIPKEHWKAVFHDNAYRVFKLERLKQGRQLLAPTKTDPAEIKGNAGAADR